MHFLPIGKHDSKRYLFLLLILLICSLQFAFNQMPIVWETHGEQVKDQFGTSIVTLDYNADGFDDLVVLSFLDPAPPGSVSQPHNWGRIYFYMGGQDSLLSRTPTFSITRDAIKDSLGTFNKLISADLNGDGLKDLIVKQNWITDQNLQEGHSSMAGGIYAFYSGTDSDTLLDFSYIAPNTGINLPHDSFEEDILYELGDINGDGCEDLGFFYSEFISYPPSRYNNKFYILYGDPVLPHVEYFCTYATNSPYFQCFFRGVGDINNDGFDDFKIMYCTPTENVIHHVRPIQAIIYGGTVIDTVLTEAQMIYPDGPTTYYSGATGAPIGDFNGDGIDDFIGYMGYPEIWFGGNNNFSSPNIIMNDHSLIDYSAIGHGDFNNDGFDDIVFGNYRTFNEYGEAFIYLGKANPNGTCDLWIHDPPMTPFAGRFGAAVAVADFNHDGCDDLAISAPYVDPSGWLCNGYVYILEGNNELIDTTTGTNDETVISTPIIFKAYPNPFNPSVNFEIRNAEKYKNLCIEIYNIKGQKLDSVKISSKQISEGTISHQFINLPSAVYLCRLKEGEKTLRTKKITLMK